MQKRNCGKFMNGQHRIGEKGDGELLFSFPFFHVNDGNFFATFCHEFQILLDWSMIQFYIFKRGSVISGNQKRRHN